LKGTATSNTKGKHIFRWLSLETFGYTLIFMSI